jgi:putative salt-induced outer membrane protein YdiY
MKPTTRIALALLACTLTITTVATADEEQTRPWTNTAEFSAVVTTGNSESTTISANNKYRYAWDNAKLTVNASFLRTESTRFERLNADGEPVVIETPETTTDNYGLGATYRRTIWDGVQWYANAGWARDRIKGIEDRYTAGGGVGYQFFENDRQKLHGEFGVSWTEETRVDETDDSFGDARAFVEYERALSETSSFSTELEVLENLKDSDDLRARSVTSVTASINKKMALKVSYKIEYDRQPVVVTLAGDPTADPPVPDALFEFDTTDTVLSASVVINF